MHSYSRCIPRCIDCDMHADLRIQNPLIQIYFIMGEKHAAYLQHPITPCNCTLQLELTTGIFDDGRWKIETFTGKKRPLFVTGQRDNERKWHAKVQELEWYKLVQKPPVE